MPASGAAPLFSVLLPTHDGERTLSVALRSVLAQTERSLEVLIVGDGCTDGSKLIAERCGDPRVRFFDLPKGPGFGYDNRNRVLERARGKHVAFMAHDDLWLPDHLALLLGELSRTGITVAYSRPLWVIPRGLCAPLSFNLQDPSRFASFVAMQESKLPAACVAHDRACLERSGGWDASLPASADWDLWARMLRVEGSDALGYVPVPTCLHFRARWRTSHNAGPLELSHWQRLHELDALPNGLRFPMSDGEVEQHAVWRDIERDPLGRTRALREAVAVALDRRIDDLDALSHAAQQNVTDVPVDSTELLHGLAQFARLRDRTEGGLAWKLAMQLQAAKARVLPEGSRRRRLWSSLRRRRHAR